MDYSSDIGKEASGSTFVMFDLRKENKPPHNLTLAEHLTSNLIQSVRPLPPLWFLVLAAANTAVAQAANTAGRNLNDTVTSSESVPHEATKI